MFDFRECFILLLFAQATNKFATLRHGGGGGGGFPDFRSHVFLQGCLYVESSEGGRGGLKRFVTVRRRLKIFENFLFGFLEYLTEAYLTKTHQS